MMPVAAKAGPRLAAGRIEVMIGRPCGASSAAPTPCSARNAMSWPGVWESPDARLAAVNTVRPSRKSLRGP